MTEHSNDPTGTQTTAGADIAPHSTSDAGRYRVHGSLPITVTVTAASGEDATGAVTTAVAEAFTGLAGAVLSPQEYTIDTPQPANDTTRPDQPDQPERYGVPVTMRGHLDVTADHADDAPTVALDTLADHLAGRTDVVADLVWAVCDTVTPLRDAAQ